MAARFHDPVDRARPCAGAVQARPTITEAALAAAGVLGLRAPRLRHDQKPLDPAVAPEAISGVCISGPRARHLFGWLVMPTLQPAPAVLVMHGWGANAATMWPVVAPLHAAGFAVLLMDARCHGRSDGEAFTSMPRFAEDIAAGLAWLRTRSGIDGNRLVLLGHSVGAGATLLHAAHHDDVCAVISLSRFAHPSEMMWHFLAEKRVPYPVIGWYVTHHVQRVIGATPDEIAPLATLPRLRCPVLLVHGRSDTTVPVDDAQRLLATCAHARLMLVDGGHDSRDGLAVHGTELVEFLHSACATFQVPKSAFRLIPELENTVFLWRGRVGQRRRTLPRGDPSAWRANGVAVAGWGCTGGIDRRRRQSAAGRRASLVASRASGTKPCTSGYMVATWSQSEKCLLRYR